MSASLGLMSGWLVALAALAVAAAWHRRLAARMELVARACHEIRGPLTAARLGLHLVERADEEARRRLDAVHGELRRACLAVDDLTLAREGGRVPDEREAVDLGALVGDAAAAWAPVAAARGTRLHVVPPAAAERATVRGDRLRLGQACANLLSNAIEHGGEVVELHWRVAGGRARVEVADSGPGLPAPVASLTRRARAGRGRRGRGLAVAADVAARHGGQLQATPSPAGARLALDLPAGPDPS